MRQISAISAALLDPDQAIDINTLFLGLAQQLRADLCRSELQAGRRASG